MCHDRPKCAAGMRRRTWNISQTEPPQPTSSQQPIGGTNTIPPPARTAPPPARAASVHAPFGCAARRTRAADALRCCRRDGNPGRRCIKSCQVRLPPRAPPPCAPPPHRNCSRTPRCPAPRARCKCACAFRPRGAPHARSRRSALLPAGRQPWAPKQQELPRCASSPRPRPPVRRRHTATVAARRATAATACLSAAACGAACASLRPKRSARRSLLAPSCAPLFAPSLPVHSLLAARRPTPDARRLCLTRAPLAALLSRNDPVRILRGLAPLAAARQL
jgi:hypothetical protein